MVVVAAAVVVVVVVAAVVVDDVVVVVFVVVEITCRISFMKIIIEDYGVFTAIQLSVQRRYCRA